MLSAVLIDNEKSALKKFEGLLKEYSEIRVVGMFKNPLEAIDIIDLIKPDVVFLDMDLKELRGTDTALKVLDLSPNTDIVVVTTSEQYAVEAFEINALDYILKPVDEKRLEKTVERIKQKRVFLQKGSSKRLEISCLGKFTVCWKGQEPIKWRTEKTKEIFAYLIGKAGRNTSREELLERLWNGDDSEKASKQLNIGINNIRKALESYGIDRHLLRIDNNYCIKLGAVDLDVATFIEHYKGFGRNNVDALKEMEDIYRGDYFEGEYYSWAVLEREKLLKVYKQCIEKLSLSYIKDKNFDMAEELLMKVFNKNPYDENVTMLLLRLYKETGSKLNATRHFNTYAKLMKEELGVEPDEKVKELLNL